MGDRAVVPPGGAGDDWAVLRGLSGASGKVLAFDRLAQLRKMLYSTHPHLAEIGSIARSDGASALAALARIEAPATSSPFIADEGDYYLSNAIARASSVMAQCSELA